MANFDFVKLGTIFKLKRKKNKLSQKDVSDFVGIKPAYVSRLENASGIDNITLNTFLRICDKLELDPVKVFEAGLSKKKHSTQRSSLIMQN